MKYQFYAIILDVAGNQVNSKSTTSPLSITTLTQLVTSVSISPNAAQTKNIGETFTITPTVGPSNANNKNVNWTSSNTNVATVSPTSTTSGVAITVTCKGAGTATITSTAADGSGKTASLSLTVINPINSLTLDKTQTTILKDGYTSTLTAITDPSDYEANNIKWTIADTSIATVTVSGKTATIKSTSKTGTTKLTVIAGSITKEVTVNVVNFVTTTYSYTGTVQQVDLPAGTYKLECWGAQGGSYSSYAGGLGGYSVGTITLPSSIKAYIYVGQKGASGNTSSNPASFNGRRFKSRRWHSLFWLFRRWWNRY